MRFSSAGMVTNRSSVSGSRKNSAREPSLAAAPACIFLFTSRKWSPLRVGKREVRKAKPLISPRTLMRPRLPQTFWTLNGIHTMIQPRLERRRSSVASKDFLTIFVAGLGFGLVLGFIFEPRKTCGILVRAAKRSELLLRFRFGGEAGAFLEGVNFIDGEVVEFLEETAGPADFNGIELDGGAEAEVDAHVAVRIVAGAAADFVDEEAGAGFQGDASADGVASGGEGRRGGRGGKGGRVWLGRS